MQNGKYNRIIFILTVITSIITIISTSLNFIIPMYLLSKLNINSNNVGIIGIIGGADGPTSIYVSSTFPLNLITIIFALLSIAGILYQIITKRLQK